MTTELHLYSASPAVWERVKRRPDGLIPFVVAVGSGGWIYYENTAPVFEDPTARPFTEYQATELVKHEALRGRAIESAHIVDHVDCAQLRDWFRRQVELRNLTATFVTAFPVEMQPLRSNA